MARPLRVEFPGAIYHVTSRGNARAAIVHDDVDRCVWQRGLERVVVRRRWTMLAFVLMDNHFHLFVRTPEPDLSRGMQEFLSAYASRFARRNGVAGHVFQGRYDARLVEDESYFWTVARYVALNPVRAGLVKRPQDWPWSSYADLAGAGSALPWVAHETLLRAWEGGFGGVDAVGTFRRFVEDADAAATRSPFEAAFDGWVLGSDRFIDKVRALIRERTPDAEVAGDACARAYSIEDVRAVVSAEFAVAPSSFLVRRNASAARGAFAAACRRWTTATNVEIAEAIGLRRGHSVATLLGRVERDESQNARLESIRQRLAMGSDPRDDGSSDR